jgi:hypothetical protein
LRVVLSGFEEDERATATQVVRASLGVKPREEVDHRTTHVVAAAPKRTLKARMHFALRDRSVHSRPYTEYIHK